MRKARILFSGNLKLDDIQIVHEPSNRKIDPDLEAKIEEIWKERFAKAKAEGKLVWDSELYRLNDYKYENGKLTLSLGTMSFGTSNTYKQTDFIDNYSEDYYPKTIYITTFIETADRMYVFGKPSGKTMVIGDYDIVGGGLNKSEKEINNGHDMFEVLGKELVEEMNIGKSDIDNQTFLGLILSDTGSVAVCLYTKLSVSSKELIAKFQKRQAKNEFTDLKFISEYELSEFVIRLGRVKPLMYQELLKNGLADPNDRPS
ncbi:hypothetical protein KC660_03715 [Candidatus Dojkabacteria bacterium]|uniref:Uncharacterized protein n=1 Tax=Candidatus Dojkabacteria bacterium TaxID=2099670 RepID=A0A955L453_9BACT|nr:hypothetical protein [Candidatus Dojkabacteria bacterium]